MSQPEHHAGKRVSFVELYLDLIFVLAVGRVAHVMVEEPRAPQVFAALGLFAVLWWTWIGFVVLYNRYGVDSPRLRLAFLTATVPGGVAAVAVEQAGHGHGTVLAIALALIRLVLGVANAMAGDSRDLLRERIALTYLGTAAVFAGSAFLHGTAQYVLWGLAVAFESGTVLDASRTRGRAGRPSKQERPATRDARRALRKQRREEYRRRSRERRPLTADELGPLAPAAPGEALDVPHFAERFGLFLIILMGEIVLETGFSTLELETVGASEWFAVAAAMIIGASLWWLYFDGAASFNEEILRLTGGSPAIARTIFAVGHMFPAFALLMIAAGIGTMIEGEPPSGGYVLIALGLGFYLLGTRVFLGAVTRRGRLLRIVLLIAIFQLGRFSSLLDPREYLWLMAAVAVACAASVARRGPAAHGR